MAATACRTTYGASQTCGHRARCLLAWLHSSLGLSLLVPISSAMIGVGHHARQSAVTLTILIVHTSLSLVETFMFEHCHMSFLG